jgi:transposase-like protein
VPFRRYTNAQKAEAVALALHIGAEAAAAQLGMDRRAVMSWMEQAGKGPELAAPLEGWRALMALSLARTTALVASGKLTPVQMATIAGIAARNAQREASRAPEAEPDPVAELVDRWEAWAVQVRPDLIEHYGSPSLALSGVIRCIFRAERMWEWDRQMAGHPVVQEDASDGEL